MLSPSLQTRDICGKTVSHLCFLQYLHFKSKAEGLMPDTASESKQNEPSIPLVTLWDVVVGMDHIECNADLN